MLLAMGILFALLAAFFASISNFCMRRSIDAGGSSKAYLVVQLTFSFLVMILLNPLRTGDFTWNTEAVILGLIGGILFGCLMWGVGKTLENGPPGLTFSVLNTASVMPGILLALLFGLSFGHPYTLHNAFGSFLVVIGLLWAGWTSEKNPHKTKWILLAILIFILHMLFLVYLQWWALILKTDLPPSPFLPFHINAAHTQWFMPSVLFAGMALQWIIYFKKRMPMPKGAEIYYGIGGGIANGICTFFLILAPQVSRAWENAMIFPIFAVAIIIICNAWAQVLYKEKVNWLANILCVAGLILGTVSWNAVFA